MESDYMYNQPESQQPAPYSQPPVFYPPYQVLVSAPNTVSQPVYYGAVAGGDLAYPGSIPGQSADYLIGSEHGVTSAPPLQYSHGNQPMCYYGNSTVNSNPQVMSAPFNAVQFSRSMPGCSVARDTRFQHSSNGVVHSVRRTATMYMETHKVRGFILRPQPCPRLFPLIMTFFLHLLSPCLTLGVGTYQNGRMQE